MPGWKAKKAARITEIDDAGGEVSGGLDH